MSRWGTLAESLAWVAILLILSPGGAMAQEDAFSAPAASETPQDSSPRDRRRGGRGSFNRFRGGPPSQAQPAEADKAESGEEKPKEEKPDESADKKDEPKGPQPITRPNSPTAAADRSELALKPDADGKIQFQFRGQKWPDVLDWLADWSDMSLDWQELPGDFLNLTTRRKYSAHEARDLINRHLLARGYTMLAQDTILSVAKIENLDPGLVPRVSPDQLADRDPHEFVKVSIPLDTLLAKDAVTELEPMISPNGKLYALENTNRLEAIDTVINLRQIYQVLSDEQSDQSQQRLVKPFHLKHTRAEEVREQLLALLGIDEKKSNRPMSREEMEQQKQMMQMRAQQQQQNKGAAPQEKKPDVFLVAIARDNIILANAPPDKMAVLEQAVLAIDVPSRTRGIAGLNTDRWNVYRLAAIDPEPLVQTLEEMGNLDPSTRLQVDTENNAIIADATLADHATIRMLVNKLDGSGRKLEVIQLQNLDAEYVAGSIQFLMVGEGEEKPQRVRYLYNYGGDRGRDDQKKDKFRVEADVEQNQLLLWCNTVELAEVQNLLVQLGEIPPEGGDQRTLRVLDVAPGDETEQLLDRIRRAWPSIAPNPLEIEPVPAAEDGPAAEAEPPADTEPAPAEPKADEPPDEDSVTATRPARQPRAVAPPHGHAFRFVQLAADDSDENEPPARRGNRPDADRPPKADPPGKTDRAGTLSPIHISRRPDGRLVITSQDTEALSLLEDVIKQLAPPREDYVILELEWIHVYDFESVITDYFDESEKKDETSSRRPYWYYDYESDTSSDSTAFRRLSKRRPLKFITETNSNSLIVLNADPVQLKVIRQLKDFYDQPEPPDSQSVRNERVFALKYSKADVIAQAVKEVYIDLLSIHDKARQQNQSKDAKVERYYFDYPSSGDDDESQKIPKFKGLLSIGVDSLSNSVIVSAPKFVMERVATMIDDLEQAARPSTTVEVLTVGRGVNPARLQEALAKVMATPPAGKQPGDGEGQDPAKPGKRDGKGQAANGEGDSN